MYHPAPPKTYLQIHTVEYAAEALSHDMLSPNRVAKSAKVVEIVFSLVPTSTMGRAHHLRWWGAIATLPCDACCGGRFSCHRTGVR